MMRSDGDEERMGEKRHSEAVFMGASVMDLMTYTERFPKPGETISARGFLKCCGGKASNACVMGAKLGLKASILVKVGEDEFGKEMLANFKHHNINMDGLFTTNQTYSSASTICVTDNGQNSIVYVPGATNMLSAEDIESRAELIFKGKLLFVSTFECDPETLLCALRLAKKYKVKTLVNAAPSFPTEYNREIFMLSDILCLNETEAEELAQKSIHGIEDAKAVIPLLLGTGCGSVLLTLGEDGVLYAEKGSSMAQHIAAPKTKPVDTTGAGDAFVGSLAYFDVCHNHLPMEEKIRRSSKIATRTIEKAGTQPSYPWKGELPPTLFL